MTDLSRLRPGTRATAKLMVGSEHTAERVGSGRIAVLATPVMINVIEVAALAAVEPMLPEGHQSLGTHLDVSHTAATPVGNTIVAEAEIIGVEGRTVTLKVVARDPFEEIGSGIHKRVVVNVERFEKRLQSKIPRNS